MGYMKWAYKDGILSHEDGSGCVIGQSVVIADELITRLIADFTESEESNTRLEAELKTAKGQRDSAVVSVDLLEEKNRGLQQEVDGLWVLRRGGG